MKVRMPLVTVIMPVFNGSDFIREAIQSVITQTYKHLELLIINDGSTDDTEQIIQHLTSTDYRIKYFKQINLGVSAARNVGLKNMSGNYFCFLDADDILPPRSIEARVEKFLSSPDLDFVDGIVNVFNHSMNVHVRMYSPAYIGNPLPKLLCLSNKCFFGPSWMIKRKTIEYQMKIGLTHGEDLLFYMNLARYGKTKYGYVNEPILIYRRHSSSAMQNLEGLFRGYKVIYNEVKNWPEFKLRQKITYLYRMRKFIFLGYIARKQFIEALSVLFA